MLNHRSLTPTSIYARLNTKATGWALQAQADSLQETHTMSVVPPENLADDRLIHISATEQHHVEYLESFALGDAATEVAGLKTG